MARHRKVRSPNSRTSTPTPKSRAPTLPSARSGLPPDTTETPDRALYAREISPHAGRVAKVLYPQRLLLIAPCRHRFARNRRSPWWNDDRCFWVTFGDSIVDGVSIIRTDRRHLDATSASIRSSRIDMSDMSPTSSDVSSTATISRVTADRVSPRITVPEASGRVPPTPCLRRARRTSRVGRHPAVGLYRHASGREALPGRA